MQMKYMRTTGTLMEVIDVLRDDVNVEIVLQLSNGQVCRIGFRSDLLFSSYIIESKHQSRVLCECLWCCNILDSVFLPESITITECA